MCSEAWAGVVGALIGILGTLGSTWLTNFLAGRKQSRLDGNRKRLLSKALKAAGGAGWMDIEKLAQIIGSDKDATRSLLIEIDARGSLKLNRETWSLLSRNPLPTIAEDGA